MTENAGEEILRVSLDRISPNPLQPRKRFAEERLKGLAQSIKSHGVLQPMIVRRHPSLPGHYELVAGERRWRALQLLDYSEVPVMVRRVKDQDLLEVALLENIQREDLSPIEEALSYRELLRRHGYTQEFLAGRIGKDRSTIANLMRLLQLPDAVQNDLEQGRMTVGHARALLALPSEKVQLLLREKLLKQDWSVRETELHVRELLERFQVEETVTSLKKMQSTDYGERKQMLQSLEEELQRHLGTRVGIRFSGKSGEIRVHYQSLEEFERLYALLKSV